MNALEKNFLRVVFGWSFISSDKGFEIKTPMSFSYAPKTLFGYSSFRVGNDSEPIAQPKRII